MSMCLASKRPVDLVNQANLGGWLPLTYAAAIGHLGAVKLLLGGFYRGPGLSLLRLNTCTAFCQPPRLTWDSHLRLLPPLLPLDSSDHGADVNLAAHDGSTPLMWASAGGSDGIVSALVATVRAVGDAKGKWDMTRPGIPPLLLLSGVRTLGSLILALPFAAQSLILGRYCHQPAGQTRAYSPFLCRVAGRAGMRGSRAGKKGAQLLVEGGSDLEAND